MILYLPLLRQRIPCPLQQNQQQLCLQPNRKSSVGHKKKSFTSELAIRFDVDSHEHGKDSDPDHVETAAADVRASLESEREDRDDVLSLFANAGRYGSGANSPSSANVSPADALTVTTAHASGKGKRKGSCNQMEQLVVQFDDDL